jgi:hypothetical protein
MKNLKKFLQLFIVVFFSLLMVKCEVESYIEPNDQTNLKRAQIIDNLNIENAVLVFGPKKFERSTNKPEVFNISFSLEEFEYLQDNFIFYIENGDKDGNLRINSGKLLVNGVEIFSPNDFKNRKGILTDSINEDEEISIELELRGKPGDFLTFSIYGQEHSQNSIIYTETAFPNQTGVIVEVMFDNSLIKCELINGMYVYQGDIILTDKQITSSTLKSAAIGNTIKRWENKTVYYTINENAPRKRQIKMAIEHWENETSIKFVERTDESNYVEFIKSDGCWSNLGMIKGRQKIGVADWAEKGTMIHEIGHTLGLIHEHSRLDREKYIVIDEDNIKPTKQHNFDPQPNSVNSSDFDFGSIMIYSAYNTFAIDYDLPTMTKLDGSTWKAQRKGLSELDIEFIDLIYNGISYLPITGNIDISNLSVFDVGVTTVSTSSHGTNFNGFTTFETPNGLYGVWHIFRSFSVISGKLKYNQNTDNWEPSSDTDISTVYAPSSNQFLNFFKWNGNLYQIGCSATSGSIYSRVYDENSSSWVRFTPTMDGVYRFQTIPAVYIDASNTLHGIFNYAVGSVYPRGIGTFYFDPSASPKWQRKGSYTHQYHSTLQINIEGKWLFFWKDGTTHFIDEYDPTLDAIVNRLTFTINDVTGSGKQNIRTGTLFKQNNEVYLSFAYTPSGNFNTNGSPVNLGILKIAELSN